MKAVAGILLPKDMPYYGACLLGLGLISGRVFIQRIDVDPLHSLGDLMMPGSQERLEVHAAHSAAYQINYCRLGTGLEWLHTCQHYAFGGIIDTLPCLLAGLPLWFQMY